VEGQEGVGRAMGEKQVEKGKEGNERVSPPNENPCVCM